MEFLIYSHEAVIFASPCSEFRRISVGKYTVCDAIGNMYSISSELGFIGECDGNYIDKPLPGYNLQNWESNAWDYVELRFSASNTLRIENLTKKNQI